MTAITERTLVTITSDAPQPVHVFDGLIKAVMDLITVAAQAPAGVIGQLTLTAQDGDQPNQRVDVHGKHVHLVKPEDVGDGKYLPFLFTLADVEWQELIPCWMRLHERCRLPISMLTGLFYSPDGYSETRLLSAAAAAEGLHRELYDKPPFPAAEFTDLRRRIKSVVDPTHRPFVFDRLHNQMTFRERLLDLLTIPDADAVRRLIREPGLWASLIRDARNGVAHALNQNRTEDGHALLFHARRVSIGLLSVVLMHEMGLSAEAQRRAAGHPELVWSARQLSDGLAPESDRTF